MSEVAKLKATVGEDVYSRLEKLADSEVGLAMKMPLIDDGGQQNFYRQRLLFPDLLNECWLFENLELKISPIDVVGILFKSKLLFAVHSEEEYRQRVGGTYVIFWTKRPNTIDEAVEEYLKRLWAEIKERALLTEINSFNSSSNGRSPQEFFDSLFPKLQLPFVSFFEGEHLIEKHKTLEPHLISHDRDQAKRFFCAPSVGYTTTGSEKYCYLRASAYLRAFLQLLRTAGFIYPGQRGSVFEVSMKPPTTPVFLGTHSTGMYCWEEDKKPPWGRNPDGSLFISFGYRGLSPIWFDERTFDRIEKHLLDHRVIFGTLENPWSENSLDEISPTLDILSSATQIPDIGAKLLLICCCLEHLFVPSGINTDTKKYVMGGINALRPDLLPWFNELYKLRNAYAHEGFVLRDNQSWKIITESMLNVLSLLLAKLERTTNTS